MTDENCDRKAELVIQYLKSAWNDGVFQEQYLSDEYVIHVNRWDDPLTLEEVRQGGRELAEAFTEFTFTINDVFTADSKVTVRYTWTGTHTGEYHGIEPTNRTITVSGIVICDVDDVITESWYVEDFFGMYRQLGEIPS